MANNYLINVTNHDVIVNKKPNLIWISYNNLLEINNTIEQFDLSRIFFDCICDFLSKKEVKEFIILNDIIEAKIFPCLFETIAFELHNYPNSDKFFYNFESLLDYGKLPSLVLKLNPNLSNDLFGFNKEYYNENYLNIKSPLNILTVINATSQFWFYHKDDNYIHLAVGLSKNNVDMF